MTGKVTRASVEEYVKDKGFEPIQIDGIPEGFSFYQRLDRTMEGINITKEGNFVGFTPNYDWEKMGAMFYMPVVFKTDDSQEIKEQEYIEAQKRFINIYEQNAKQK